MITPKCSGDYFLIVMLIVYFGIIYAFNEHIYHQNISGIYN